LRSKHIGSRVTPSGSRDVIGHVAI